MSQLKPLLCIFAHPDDEAFGPGGSIAKFVKKRDVYIICVTDGCKGSAENLDSDKDLSEVRKRELLESAKILGVKKVDFLNYTDGILCNNLYHEIAEKLIGLIKTYQPDTLLTFDSTGVSGHLDHIAVSLITSFVFKKLDNIKKLLYLCELEETLNQFGDYFVYTPPGRKLSEIDLTIDISETWKLKVKSMQAHKSQIKDAEKILKILSNKPKENYFRVLQK